MTIELKDKTITDKEYIETFQPVGVWVLIEKDELPEKTSSGIILATAGRDTARKFSGTGIIRGMTPEAWQVFEQNHDQYWRNMFKVGDRVGFSVQTPILSPAPPQWKFASGDTGSTKFIQITITDITGIFLHTPEMRKEWEARFKGANNG